jgi:hypothetical protein
MIRSNQYKPADVAIVGWSEEMARLVLGLLRPYRG